MEAHQMVSEDDAVIIDVREPDEWGAARIPAAELKPMSTISEWHAELPTDKTVIVQCASGSRSHAVVHALITQAGMSNVVNLAGGIIAWSADELPVDTSHAGG